MRNPKIILVTGATGYVGGQLIPRLLEEGYKVRALVREPRKLKGFTWKAMVDIAVGDVLAPENLESALSGIDAAYYLVHNMTGGPGFAQKDILAAKNFGEAARKAGVSRVIYLGGLGKSTPQLSEHLRSRQETGEALRRTGVSLTEFRAAIIVGSGSISFEMIRNLTERIPIMICPRWVKTRVQPIAAQDVLSYLVASLKNSDSANQVIEIGGADVLTYGDMMKAYARVRGLHRLMVNVPVLTPRLSSYWVHWVTPVSAAFARPLIEGLRSEVIATDNKASKLFPGIKPVSYTRAVQQALSQLNPGNFADRKNEADENGDAACFSHFNEGMIVEVRQRAVTANHEAVYKAFTQLGGAKGWPCNLAWRVRGAVDRILGGIGMRKSRPVGRSIEVGDTIDFFRVVKVEPDRMIRLKVEMKLPGDGWVQFEAKSVQANLTNLAQTVFFAPRGLAGIIYWYLMLPIHKIIFARMIRMLAAEARRT